MAKILPCVGFVMFILGAGAVDGEHSIVAFGMALVGLAIISYCARAYHYED